MVGLRQDTTLNEYVVQENYYYSDDEDTSDDEDYVETGDNDAEDYVETGDNDTEDYVEAVASDAESIDEEYNSDEDEDYCPDDESDNSDEDDEIDPFPEELEIRNAKYTHLCKSVYFRLESYAMESYDTENDGATLAQVLYYYNWNDINEDQIPRPTCTDDVEKILFKVFDTYSEHSGCPWYGTTHNTLIQH